MTKITKREKFEMLLAMESVKENGMLVEFIEHEIELLARKNGSEKKPTAQQTANAEIQKAILESMEVGKRYTITELIKTVPACAELTNQRVSALVRQLMPTYIERVEEKKKAMSVLMKTQTGRDFSFDDRLVSIVAVIRIDVEEYTAKHRPIPEAMR